MSLHVGEVGRLVYMWVRLGDESTCGEVGG